MTTVIIATYLLGLTVGAILAVLIALILLRFDE